MISLNQGLLDPWSAVAGALIVGIVYGQRKDLKLWATLDNLTIGLAVFGAALGLSQLASGQGYGLPSEVPWAIELWGAARHPSQVYEILAAGFILAFVLRSLRETKPQAGLLFIQFVSISAGARLYLEAFRGQGLLLPNGWRVAQIVAWVVLAVSLWGYWRLNKERQSAVR